jgi:hypothetical protein
LRGVAADLDRRTEEPSQILHGQEVSHLLLGDRENAGAPALDHLPPSLVWLVGTQRVRGVEVLHHQAVLDGGAKRQQHQQVVAPRHVGPLGVPAQWVARMTGGRIGLRAKAHRAPPNRPVLLS